MAVYDRFHCKDYRGTFLMFNLIKLIRRRLKQHSNNSLDINELYSSSVVNNDFSVSIIYLYENCHGMSKAYYAKLYVRHIVFKAAPLPG